MTRARPNSRKVLVVDDDDVILTLVSRQLAGTELTALTASDGVEGVKLFGERMHEIVCVLIDWKMPGLSGNDVYERIRALSGTVPVILTSGYGEAESTAQFNDGDLAGFLQKPFKSVKLRAQLQRALDGVEG